MVFSDLVARLFQKDAPPRHPTQLDSPGNDLCDRYGLEQYRRLAAGISDEAWLDRHPARKTSMFLFALCVVPILFATSVGDWSAVLLIGLAGAAHQAWSANLYSTASDMFPKNAVASLIGIGSAAGSVGGMIFPIVTGVLLDKFQANGNVTAGYSILFVICAFAYLVAFALNHLCAPKFELVPFEPRNL